MQQKLVGEGRINELMETVEHLKAENKTKELLILQQKEEIVLLKRKPREVKLMDYDELKRDKGGNEMKICLAIGNVESTNSSHNLIPLGIFNDEESSHALLKHIPTVIDQLNNLKAFLKSASFEYCFITYKDFNNAHEIPNFFGHPHHVDPNNTTVQRWSFKYPNSCKDNLLIVIFVMGGYLSSQQIETSPTENGELAGKEEKKEAKEMTKQNDESNLITFNPSGNFTNCQFVVNIRPEASVPAPSCQQKDRDSKLPIVFTRKFHQKPISTLKTTVRPAKNEQQALGKDIVVDDQPGSTPKRLMSRWRGKQQKRARRLLIIIKHADHSSSQSLRQSRGGCRYVSGQQGTHDDVRRAAATTDSRRSQHEKMEGGETTETRNDISTKPKDSGNKRRAEKTSAIPILMKNINP
ncbi:hypothetical protein GCK72_019639 [Caenorhabditis remanei]|uniref:Uncharacterized protein n=1 Tax=Caenorhabditis remanei TaxID=31234 RepID=A0A6A5GEJ0_CAERE|nr:hypothetical protein GCK72_019639 [Caenorhabditis remanei]KAF1753083.1 hypothetical protein GCK72_019639 [Caenorhabditis remanei]